LLNDYSGSVLGDSTVFSWAGCHTVAGGTTGGNGFIFSVAGVTNGGDKFVFPVAVGN
jgi:hypothetical protein